MPLFYHCSGMPYVLREGLTLAAGMSSDVHSSAEMSIAAVFTRLQLLPTWDIRARMPDPSAGMPTKAPQAFPVGITPSQPPLLAVSSTHDLMIVPLA